ncbi:MAG: outer membrane beta-barrel protein [Paludibacteraceae bacterium]|nr:outer membrane beta-barrel protein [Paludibacteraceae bacterium]
MKRHRYILILCMVFAGAMFVSPVMAQYSISGTVVNRRDGSAIEVATIRLFKYHGKDSTMVHGMQTSLEGEFVMSDVKAGSYSLWVSNVGFKPKKVNVLVRASDVAMGSIALEEDIQTLKEVQVQGHAAEMIVKGDTIEYNTTAYKMGENAMVEDLLKKMNGITVDKEGNVTVNGETITAVRIDGKKFFGNDIQSATKNIPADMIDKVQVIEEKSDIAKMTGFEDDESEHIINLKLKKDRKKGLFGKYTGGLGMDMVTDNGGWFNYGSSAFGATPWDRTKHFFANDFRYNLNLFTNLMLDESQTTIIGGANNTNEVLMGRGRKGFGNDANSGITWSESLGVNTNVDLNDKITPKDNQTSLLLGGDLALNHSFNDTQSESTKTEYADSTTYRSVHQNESQKRAWGVNLRMELEYQIDTLNKLLIQPELSYGSQSGLATQEYEYWRDSIKINHGSQTQIDSTRDISVGTKLTYSYKFSKPGRSLTVKGEYSFANTTGYNQTHAVGTNQVWQYTNSGNTSHYYSLRASYVEPIYSTNHLLEIAAQVSGRNRRSHKDQFSMDTIAGQFAYDSTYSNRLQNDYYSEQLEVNYRWITQKSDLTVGLRAIAGQTFSRTEYGNYLRDTMVSVWNFAPSVKFRYKFGKKEFARINYRGTTTQPTITQLEPVRNNSNAMNETVGNLALNPAFRHNLRFMYSRFNSDQFSSIMTGISASFTKDALVNNSIYDETGKLYQQTVNANSMPWNIGGDFMFNIPFLQKQFQFNTRTSLNYNQRVSYVQRGQSAAAIAAMIASNTFMLGEQSSTGNLRVSEDLSLRFTHQLVDVGVKGAFAYSRTENNLTQNSLSNVFDWNITGDIEFHLPKSWTIRADCGYTARYGYNLSNVNEVILNASIDKSWNLVTLSLNFYDILNQKKNIMQVVGENSISYSKYNTLPTYFMLTCSVRVNRMGDLKAKGMAGHMQEMIESGFEPNKMPPGGGTPPPGPPPGM